MRKIKRQKESDFWWLTPNEKTKYKYVLLMHLEPYSDEPNSDREPLSVRKFHSLDASGSLSEIEKHYPLEFISQWRKKCANVNIFRSLSLFSTEEDEEALLCPFVIDIDRQDESDKGYVPNIDKALEDTRRLVKEYLGKLKEDEFRIFFTGHKGFNIEVRPQALGIISVPNRWRQFRDRRADINRTFGDNFIDTIKDHVRLHDSINRWIANDGKEVNRMKFELSLRELNSLGVEEILRKSKRLALNYLSKKAM